MTNNVKHDFRLSDDTRTVDFKLTRVKAAFVGGALGGIFFWGMLDILHTIYKAVLVLL